MKHSRTTLAFGMVGLTMMMAGAHVLAHVTVAPQQAPLAASQIYKVRVHNEGTVPTRSIALEIPAGVVVEDVAQTATAQAASTTAGGRTMRITWQVAVPAGKYVELAFTATNPSAGTALIWSITEAFADGTLVEYTDKPGAKAKASVTKLTAASAAK